MQSLSKSQTSFFAEIDRLMLKFIWKFKGPRVAKTILKKKNKVEVFTLPDFKIYFKSTIVKTVFYLNKNRYVDQWSITESLETNTYLIYGQLVFKKGVKKIQWRK